LEMILFLLGAFIGPLMTIFLALAARSEKRTPPRALLWCIAAILLALAGLVLTSALLLDAGSSLLAASVVMLTLIVGPVVLLISLPAVYFAARALPEVRAALLDDLNLRASGLIQARGEMSFAQLASELDIPIESVDNLLDDLLRAGKFNGTLLTRWQRVYTTTALAEKQRFLLEQVRSQGRVRMADLARTLNAPPELTRDWLYQLVQRGQFTGYINWDHGWLYASIAQRIGADSQCPNCGGQLSPGPAQTIRCLYCGSEILTRVVPYE
jgi:DNA-binding Lrp family transcriptional regulator